MSEVTRYTTLGPRAEATRAAGEAVREGILVEAIQRNLVRCTLKGRPAHFLSAQPLPSAYSCLCSLPAFHSCLFLCIV